MNVFLDFFQQLFSTCIAFWDTLNSPTFSVILQIVSFLILFKVICNLTKLFLNQPDLQKKQSHFIFFIIPTIAIMSENIAWIIRHFFPKTTLARIVICIAWIISCFKFHSLAIFLEKITEKNNSLKAYHKILFTLETILCFGFIADCACLISYNTHLSCFAFFENITFALWFISIIPSTMTILSKLTHNHIPIVLKKQLQIILIYLITPHLICLVFEFFPKIVYHEYNNIAFATLGIIFITSTLYFCYKRIIQFRFLNLSDHVQIPATTNISFTENIKEIIDQLNFASNAQELQLVTQNFFYEQLHISKQQIVLYLRNTDKKLDPIQEEIEQFLNNENLGFNPVQTAISHKILIGHEIDFDAFSSENVIVCELSRFLRSIDSDLFIPVLSNKKITGYIIVKKDKKQNIYNLEQQNKMVVFAQFLAPAIYLLSQQNIYKLMQEAKETKEDLHAKHQEVNQYKESIKKLLKDRIENHIGIIFYKQKHFSFRNQEAQQLIGLNPNLQQNHPTTATLINLAQQVERFKSTQTMCMTIHNGSKLIVSGMPYAESSGGVLLTVRQPEATDIIKMQLDALKDPSKRDYLLYLETTEAGKLINKLLPSKNEVLLQTKIELLQAALQKNALLLQSHPEDVIDIASLIHQISLKEAMHILNLETLQDETCATKLFGINPLLQSQKELSLLEKLDNGTLVIKNIECLDIVSQQKLAYFIRYGIFTPLKSEQRKFSDVRIICSTIKPLQDLVQSGQITQELYKELQKSSLTLPSLLCLTQEDLSDLIDGFMHQAIQDDAKNSFAPLNINEKNVLLQKRLESISEFKKKIHNFMIIKSQERAISQETVQSKKSFDTSCPDFQLAAQLGKEALKDSKLMTSLWEKLGSQTKIAELLGVNRSSVNRRCKDYNLI